MDKSEEAFLNRFRPKRKPFKVMLTLSQEARAIKHAIAQNITIDQLLGQLVDGLPELD